MGKLATIYLSDQEAKALARFCEENGCSQYSAIKTAIKELMLEKARGNAEETSRTGEMQNNPIVDQQPAEKAQAADSNGSGNDILRMLLRSNTRKS